MVQPINYTIPVADPFESLTRGMNLGLQMEQVQAARQQRAMQAQQMQAEMEAARQKAEQDAAKAAELARLQEIPLEGMTQSQRFRLMELTQSEATRAHMARAYESLSTEQRANQARASGSLVVALGSNPQVGIRRLQTMIEAEKDPAQKQALQVALQIAEVNPLEAARMIDGTLSMAGPEFSKVAESARNYLKNTGKPLYPEKPTYRNVGGSVLNEATGEFLTPPRQSQLLSPEEEAQKKRIAAAGRAPAQPREPAAPTITQIQDPTDPSQMITIDARRYQGGSIGSPGVIGASGKTPKAAEVSMKQEQGRSDASNILDTLRTAYDELDRMRAIPSEQRGTISNVLAGVAATGVGQTAGRMVGTKEQTQRDIIASARNQLFAAVKNATGLSAQNLNSNVEFTTWLNSLTDPSRSIEANRAILENMERFIASGGKRSGGNAQPPTTQPPSQDQYRNLSNEEILRRLRSQ